MARRRGQEQTSYLHPALTAILAETYGVVLYQEQAMRIACEIGGYTAGEADKLRREMARRAASLQEVHGKKFINGAVRKGFSKQEA